MHFLVFYPGSCSHFLAPPRPHLDASPFARAVCRCLVRRLVEATRVRASAAMTGMQLLYPVGYWDGEVPAHEITCMVKGVDGSYLVTGSKTGELCYWKPDTVAADNK